LNSFSAALSSWRVKKLKDLKRREEV